MARARSVLVTANFERNLAEIRDFLSASAAFDELIGRLESDVVPNLERFPELGAEFLALDGRVLFEAPPPAFVRLPGALAMRPVIGSE